MEFDLFDTAYNGVLQAKTYDEYATRLRAYDCRRCPRAAARSRIVVDRGNPAASVMIISERPGTNEDRRGAAFVGRAGEMLDKILAAIRLDSNRDVLIRNVVRCIAEEDRAGQNSGFTNFTSSTHWWSTEEKVISKWSPLRTASLRVYVFPPIPIPT